MDACNPSNLELKPGNLWSYFFNAPWFLALNTYSKYFLLFVTTAPPSPKQPIFLPGKKLKVPISPNVPTCLLFIDDAHGFGVTRKDHRRFPSSLNGIKNSQIKIDAYVGTFGKAIGTFGAFISGSKNLIDLLIQKSKPYVYSTALPPAIAKTTLDSINYIMDNQSISRRLKENISYLKNNGFNKFALVSELMNSEDPKEEAIMILKELSHEN